MSGHTNTTLAIEDTSIPTVCVKWSNFSMCVYIVDMYICMCVCMYSAAWLQGLCVYCTIHVLWKWCFFNEHYVNFSQDGMKRFFLCLHSRGPCPLSSVTVEWEWDR